MSAKQFLVFILVLMFCLFIWGCQSDKPNQTLSSFSQVQEDFAAGKIDYDTAVLYKTYSLFNHPGLPKKYKSDQHTRSGTTHLKELRRNWNKLSKETQEKLNPFLMNPIQKGSFYLQQAKAPEKSLLRQAYADTPALPSDFGSLYHHDAANGKVKIWWREGDSQQALWLIEAFDDHHIYERETALMARHPKSDMGTVGTDDRLDVLLENITDMGLCFPGETVNHKTSSHIYINKAMTKNEVQNAIAHELFHSIQFNFDVDEADWWQEQTATWIEDKIYPGFDIEHKCLPAYFKDFQMRNSLVFENGKFEYGAYVWPLYLSQKYGPSIIKKIWNACESSGALNAFISTIPGGFDNAFKEFALWVYNSEPERKFRDIGGGFLPVTPSIADQPISADGLISPVLDLDFLSLTMEKYLLTAQVKEQIRSIDFDLADFHAQKPKIAVWAIIKIANEDEVVEDWSNVNFRNYCFDLPEENLENIVFVLANTSLVPVDNANLLDYTAKEYGCEAKLSLNWSAKAGGKGNYEYVFKNSGGAKASMGGELSFREDGNLSVSFIENTVNPDDATDSDTDKQLVPFGGFSVHSSNQSKATWAPLESHKITGTSSLTCSASDTWNGKTMSQKEYAAIRLEIVAPELENNNPSDQGDLTLIPPEMQQQLAQMKTMAESLQKQFKNLPGMPRQLQPNERRYKIFLSFGNLPATFSTNLGDSSEEEQTTFSPQTLDLEGIFAAEQTIIPINQKTTHEAGSGLVSGTLRIKKK